MDWNILGHEWAAQLLAQHIARREVRHAYLFTGPPGVGRRTLALRFAQAINCTQPPEAGQPCGKCRNCTHIESLNHPDLIVVQPVDEDGNPSEGAALKINQMRALQHSLSLAPYEAQWKVALLLRFQEATDEAQNALLKTLEEAPERVVLLLIADSAENLLPTIASRCEILRLHPLPLQRLEQALQERWGVEAHQARLLAHLSGGRLGYALRLQRNPTELERRQAWLDDLLHLLSASRRARLQYVDKENLKDREQLRPVLPVWQTFWRDVMLAANGSSVPLTNLDRQEDVLRVAAHVSPAAARAYTADLEQACQRLEANVNPRLLAEVLLLDWPIIK